jgi:mono/diheme cytochrome c family protein
MKKLITKFAFSLLAVLSLTACGKHSSPYFIYMPDMYWTKGLKYQQPGMRPPVPGTVARGHHPMPASMTMDQAGKEYQNPLRRTPAVLERGRHVFNQTCIVCHGPKGEGDGTIVPKFPRPPSLVSDKLRGFPDGNIYYIITHGQNLMASYASQVLPEDRWAIVHYIRALQRANKPTSEDLKTAGN